MRWAMGFPIALILFFLGPGTQLLTAQTAPAIAEIIAVEGKVELRRAGNSRWEVQPDTTETKGKPITLLNRGDLLKVQKGSKAVIRCTNFRSITRTVPDDGVPWGVASVCSPLPGSNQ